MISLLAALLMFQPRFEVASIKPAAPDAKGMYIRNAPGGRVNVTNMTLKELVVMAYRIQPFQIAGGPSWFDSAHFDMSAKAEENAKPGEMPLMLQALLADRFQLVLQKDTKEMPVYALVLARKDGKLGPKLTEKKEGGCETFDPAKPPAPVEPGAPRRRYCGNMMMSPRSLNGVGIPVSNMVPMLARMLGRTVIDKTGLTAKYDISMEWAPDDAQLAAMGPDAPRPAPSDTPGPSIYTALQEQLGLKLESQKGPVEVFTVVKAEKPSEN